MNDVKKSGLLGKNIIVVIMLILMLIGGTFALFLWETNNAQRTSVFFAYEDSFQCAVDGGGNITSEQIALIPTDCLNSEHAIKRQITVMPTINQHNINVSMDLWLDINNIGQGLSDSVNFKYALTTNENSCTDDVIVQGNFNKKITGDYIDIFKEKIYFETANEIYYLYVWLDEEESSSSTMNQSFELSLNGSCEKTKSLNNPRLENGMIPVVISDDGVVTTVLSDDSDWYNYGRQEWANVVLVDSDSRSTYLGTSGTVVDQSDILAYYVWIPRYKYKIWTTGVSSAGNEQTIDIMFENKSEPMTLGTKVGEYRTHPAFWWDYNSDGVVSDWEMLPGIWVGKFETTGTADNPTILPNTGSLSSQSVSAQFSTGLRFAGGVMNTSTGEVTFSGNNTYGLTNGIDSHMMKNSEWGAVAYLSHSQYGINDEIRVNNYYDSITLTGCGALTENESSSTTCGIRYGQTGDYPQSTTGNITGIFDIAGGFNERITGNFNGVIGSSGFTTLPDLKYYDKYTITNISECTIAMCGGHALNETYGWYSDPGSLVNSSKPWYHRGGASGDGASTGAFRFSDMAGDAHEWIGFRSVLVPLEIQNVTYDANGGILSDVLYTEPGEHMYSVSASGEYKLEVWGASGGDSSGMYNGIVYKGGYGGYSVGNVSLMQGDKLYVNVGGEGVTTNKTQVEVVGGYNGGGSVMPDLSNGWYAGHGGGSGGGATHIATVSGQLSALEGYKGNLHADGSTYDSSKILIVAGGGGGAGDFYWSSNGTYRHSDGGHGGGVNGGVLVNDTNQWCGAITVPNQTSGGSSGSGVNGSFGKGGASVSGAGGGFYGGVACSGGTGGSGYIGSSLLSNKSMYCYNCTSSSNVNTLTYSTTNYSSTPSSNYAKSGDGAARITSYFVNKSVLENGTYGDMPIPTRKGYTFVGWNTQPDGSGETITSSTVMNSKENLTLYAVWRINKVYVNFHINGGTITSSTTNSSGTKTYTWTTTDSIIYKNGNAPFYSIDYDGTGDLPNYNNSNYIYLTRTDYTVPDGAEWVCSSGCTTANKTFNHSTTYNASDFCDASDGDCTVVVKVNWEKSVVPIGNHLVNTLKPSGLNNSIEGGLYRFQGTGPNNYICFGTSTKSTCTGNTDKYMFRIIGISSNGELKLIKNEALNSTTYAWSSSSGATWPNSNVYAGINSSWFLSGVASDWSDLILSKSWPYDGLYGSACHLANCSATDMYNLEVSFSTQTTAKIGLMHIHDYYYAYQSGGINCSATNGAYTNCANAWIHLKNCDASPATSWEWVITRYGSQYGYTTQASGAMSHTGFSNAYSVRPVFYVSSTVNYVSGTGTSSDPFIIVAP